MNAIENIAARLATPLVHRIALLGLCAAYLQGGIVKATDFSGTIAEMDHFGLALAGFTLMATLIALRFWELPPGQERFMAANAFFEHLGLVGGFLLVAWHDLKRSAVSKQGAPSRTADTSHLPASL